MDLKKGDRLNWLGVHVTVLRVARDGSWADIRCRYNRAEWSKRQALPMIGALPIRPVRIFIGNPIGWCAACGAPILDCGYSDDPELWEHSWAYPKHGSEGLLPSTLGQ